MAITQTLCNVFRQDCMLGQQNLTGGAIKLALYTSNATLNADTTVYTTANEVVGTGYMGGGNTLTGATVSLSGTTAYANFANSNWPLSQITARGALIYNSSNNKAIAVLDFGADKVSSGGDFTVQFPANTATSALIRLTGLQSS
jgi:hypothetical protein